MRWMWLIAAITAMLPTALAAHPPAAPARIEISYFFTNDVCTGICSDTRLIITADGRITVQFGGIFHHGHWSNRRFFLVDAASAASFFRLMHRVEPDDDRVDTAGCDTELHQPKVMDWDIWWIGTDNAVRLRSCDNDQAIWRAWTAATKVIGMPYGMPRPTDTGYKEVSHF